MPLALSPPKTVTKEAATVGAISLGAAEMVSQICIPVARSSSFKQFAQTVGHMFITNLQAKIIKNRDGIPKSKLSAVANIKLPTAIIKVPPRKILLTPYWSTNHPLGMDIKPPASKAALLTKPNRKAEPPKLAK